MGGISKISHLVRGLKARTEKPAVVEEVFPHFYQPDDEPITQSTKAKALLGSRTDYIQVARPSPSPPYAIHSHPEHRINVSVDLNHAEERPVRPLQWPNSNSLQMLPTVTFNAPGRSDSVMDDSSKQVQPQESLHTPSDPEQPTAHVAQLTSSTSVAQCSTVRHRPRLVSASTPNLIDSAASPNEGQPADSEEHSPLSQNSPRAASTLDLSKGGPAGYDGNNDALGEKTKPDHSGQMQGNSAPPLNHSNTSIEPSSLKALQQSKKWVKRIASRENLTYLRSEAKETNGLRHVRYEDQAEKSKIHVRRPPPGIQHWFEGLDEGNDDKTRPAAKRPEYFGDRTTSDGAGRTSSANSAPSSRRADRMAREKASSKSTSPATAAEQARKASVSEASQSDDIALVPSRDSQLSGASLSTKTKDSTFSGSNLQDHSVLSLSSSDADDSDYGDSEDRDDVSKTAQPRQGSNDAVDFDESPTSPRMTTRPGELASSYRRPSQRSIGATKDYSQGNRLDPPKRSTSYTNRPSIVRPVQTRKPSSIYETEEQPRLSSETIQARTVPQQQQVTEVVADGAKAIHAPEKPSVPDDGRKYIAVTAEEEAILEMMRSNRAYLAKKQGPDVQRTLSDRERHSQLARHSRKHCAGTRKNPPRTSAFLTLDSPLGTAFPRPPSLVSSTGTLKYYHTNSRRIHEDGWTSDRESSEAIPRLSPSDYSNPYSQFSGNPHSRGTHVATESLVGSTTASTIMPSDSISAFRAAPPSSRPRLPPMPDAASPERKAGFSEVLAYDSSDMFPSPSTAATESPPTPLQITAPAGLGATEVVDSDEGAVPEDRYDDGSSMISPRSAYPRSRAVAGAGGGVGSTELPDDGTSIVTTGSMSVLEINGGLKKQLYQHPPLPSLDELRELGKKREQTSKASKATKTSGAAEAAKALSEDGRERDSISEDVRAAWGALGGWPDVDKVAVET